jgi:hypothetical protein
MEFDYRKGMKIIRYPEAEEKKYPSDQAKGSVGRENRGRPLLLQFHISISLYPLAKANLSPRLTD